LDFGDAWEQDKFDWPVTIENRSTEVKEVTGISGSCTCQAFDKTAFTLQPGESTRVLVTLSLHAKRNNLTATPSEEFESAIWVTVKGEPALPESAGGVRK
jgi:hypothetical protein